MIDWTSPRKYKDSYNFNFKLTKKLRTKPLNAAINTVKYISKNYPAPYMLCLSGGVDSQAMLYAWKESGIPFKTCCAVYNKWLNEHDYIDLQNFAKTIDVPISYLDLDVIEFLHDEHNTYANKYHCGSPQITTFMKIADSIKDGTVCMSGNFKLLNMGIPDFNNFAMFKYGTISNRSIVPWFFAETMELFHSFEYYGKSIIDNFSTVQDGFDSGSFDSEPKDPLAVQYDLKVKLYQEFGFPVIPQKIKFNGFEKIKQLYDMKEYGINAPDKLSKLPIQNSTRNFDILFRNKYELKFAKYSYNVKI